MVAYRVVLPLLLLTTSLGAQRSISVTAPTPDRANAAPVYPQMLRSSGVEGRARFTFLLDSTGSPDVASFRVRETTHDAFAQAVRRAAQHWYFSPNRRTVNGVADSVEVIAEFALGERGFSEILPTVMLSQERLSSNQWRMVIGPKPLPDPLRPVAESLHLAIAAAALDTLLSALPVDTTAPARVVCVALGMSGRVGQPSPAFLRALSRRDYTALALRRCPPTFRSMITVVGGEPDPPGEDPWAFTPGVPYTIDDSSAVLDVQMAHATTFGTYRCYMERDRAYRRGWRANCVQVRLGVSQAVPVGSSGDSALIFVSRTELCPAAGTRR